MFSNPPILYTFLFLSCKRNVPLSLKGQYNLAAASQRLVIKVALVAVAKQVARARFMQIKDEELFLTYIKMLLSICLWTY